MSGANRSFVGIAVAALMILTMQSASLPMNPQSILTDGAIGTDSVREGFRAEEGLPDQTVFEGEEVFFNGTIEKTLPEVNKTSPNIKVNDVNVTEGWGGWCYPKLDESGNAYIIWVDTRDGMDAYFDKAPRYGTFGTDHLMDDDFYWTGGPNGIAIGANGEIHAVWSVGPYGPKYARSTDKGETFTSPVDISDAGAPGGPDVAIDSGPDGSLHAVWGSSFVRYRSSSDGGKSWNKGQLLREAYYPDVAVADNGSVYIVWTEMIAAGGHEVFFTRKSPGESFSTPIRVHPAEDWVRQGPSIAVSGNGEIMIAWKEAGLPGVGEQKVAYARSVDGGSTFENPPVIRSILSADEPHIFQGYPVVTSYGEEGFAVGWSERWEIYPQDVGMMVSISWDGGEHFGPYTRVDDYSAIKIGPQITGNVQGDLFMAWRDSRNQPPGISMGSEIFGVWINVSASPLPVSYEWDFDASVDSDGDGNYTNDIDATGQAPEYVYEDDGEYTVTLTMTDANGDIEEDSCEITVLNAPPTADLSVQSLDVDLSVRVTGEKWHDVRAEVYEDDVLISSASTTRYPGTPDDQLLHTWNASIDISKTYSALISYTPEDDRANGQPNGATPVWIILRFSSGEFVELHHTFVVGHPEGHVWEADLTGDIISHDLAFTGSGHDQGADDLTFFWDFGDGTYMTSFYPDTDNVGPSEASETITHAFPGPGTYTITLRVEDDDGGFAAVATQINIQ